MMRAALVTTFVGVMLFLTAGAAGAVGEVTVSNATPAPGSSIAVTSTGWFPGRAVTVGLSGIDGIVARSTADATGSVHTRVVVPANTARDTYVLAVTGTASSGVPQQIVTRLAVHHLGPAPAPVRPWALAIVLATIAGVLLLVSITSVTPTHRLAT